jgi:predicted O-methyltransferase YrrM
MTRSASKVAEGARGSARAANAKRLATRLRLAHEAPQLSPKALEILADMYSLGCLEGTESELPVALKAGTRITIGQGAGLHKLVRDNGVRKSLEIGFAYGFSTIWIIDGLSGRADSSHVAVDPFEKSQWGGVGLRQVERLGLPTEMFTWHEKHAVQALAQMVGEGAEFDLIFIDGNHRFDDILVDFYLADQLVRVGGLIAFDDMWMQAVQSVVSFVRSNRHYELVPQPVKNMAVLRKLAHDTRQWDHYRPFRTRFPTLPIARRLRSTWLYKKLRAR